MRSKALLIHRNGETPVEYEETPEHGIAIYVNGELFVSIVPAQELPEPQIKKTKEPQVSDLTGDPPHDYPLMLRRFRKNPYVLRTVAQYYKEKEGFSSPGIDNMAQAEKDLELILSLLPEIVNDGQFVRGARSKIARKLDIKDAGHYRQRIDAVMWVALAEIEVVNDDNPSRLGKNEAPLGKIEGQLEKNQKNVGSSNKSTAFEKRQKAAGE